MDYGHIVEREVRNEEVEDEGKCKCIHSVFLGDTGY